MKLNMAKIVGVRFKPVGKIYHFNPGRLDIKVGDQVIVETTRGIEFGTVVVGTKEVPDKSVVSPLKNVIRLATAEDKRIHSVNSDREKSAYGVCCEKIKKHKLKMKLVDVEYAFDGSKILFYFTADGRIDFRELVKDLATVFKRTRIEMRQIGVRDETKKIGSVGICGRDLCCSSFLGDFEPVSIKMAKEQGLSPNPIKISGSCGRLMCCLKYEQDAYEELIKVTPGPGSTVQTPSGKGVVEYANLLKGLVKVRIDGEKEKALHEFSVDDIKIIKRAAERDDDRFKTLKDLEK